jgi:hypothetical protein
LAAGTFDGPRADADAVIIDVMMVAVVASEENEDDLKPTEEGGPQMDVGFGSEVSSSTRCIFRCILVRANLKLKIVSTRFVESTLIGVAFKGCLRF